jgi:transcriptional regulator with XRE-family HTH domain
MPQRPDPQIALGEVIRERREALELSQEGVALAADTTQGRISEIESGDNPSYGLAGRIAWALGWSHAELVERVEAREAALAQAKDPSEGTKPAGPAA